MVGSAVVSSSGLRRSQYSTELALELDTWYGRRARVPSPPHLRPHPAYLDPTPHQVAPNKRLRPVESVRPSVRLDGPPPTGTGKRKCGRPRPHHPGTPPFPNCPTACPCSPPAPLPPMSLLPSRPPIRPPSYPPPYLPHQPTGVATSTLRVSHGPRCRVHASRSGMRKRTRTTARCG